MSRPKKKQPNDPDRQYRLVPEICYLTGLSEWQREDHSFMKRVSSVTRSSPQARSQAIRKFVNAVKESPECVAILSGWGLELEDAALVVDGRVLDPVKIVWGGGKTDHVDGDIKVRNQPMLKPKFLHNWIVVFHQRHESHAKFLVTVRVTCYLFTLSNCN